MILPDERDIRAFGDWHSAATLSSAIVLIGLAIGWPMERATTSLPSASARCVIGDEVSNFVCRNRWMADLKHHQR